MSGTRAVELTQLREEKLDQLMVHENEMFGTEAWSRESYRSELADSLHRHYLAALDPAGTLLGWAGVMVVADSADILTVGVVLAARRHGIGRLLLRALLDVAAARGASEVFLEVREDNPAARELYRAEGFVQIGIRRGYYDGGRADAVTMRKPLTVRAGAGAPSAGEVR